MSENPYSRADLLSKAWRAERNRLFTEKRAFRTAGHPLELLSREARARFVYNVPPTLDEIKAAYVAEEIDVFELDRLTGFALERKVCPDLPLAVTLRIYERMQSRVRFSDAPIRGVSFLRD